jgi:hypothetical protein
MTMTAITGKRDGETMRTERDIIDIKVTRVMKVATGRRKPYLKRVWPTN